MRRLELALAVGLVAIPSACSRERTPPVPAALTAGQSFYLYAPEGWSCDVVQANERWSLATASSVEGQHPSPEHLTVIESVVEWPHIITQVQTDSGRDLFLRVPARGDTGCLFRDPEPLVQALSLTATSHVFTPWKPQCTELHATGVGAESLLVEAEPGRALTVDGVSRGPRIAGGAEPATDLWIDLANRTLAVRADVLATCFTPADQAAAEPTPSALDLLGVPAGRCPTKAPKHVVCESTVGVWAGKVRANLVQLSKARRTLGSLHFHDDELVSGAEFATTVAAIEVRVPEGERGEILGRALAAAVQAATPTDETRSIRLTTPEDPEATHVVSVVATDLDISELHSRSTQEQSRYKIRDEVVRNPKKGAAAEAVSWAEQRVEEARFRLQEAEQDYERDVRRFEEMKRKAADDCRRNARRAEEGPARTLSEGVCDVASTATQFVNPSRSRIEGTKRSLREAESDLRAAERDERQTPDTITEPVMGTWSYRKLIHERTATVTLEVALRRLDGSTIAAERIPLSHHWVTHEVAPDPAHGVAGMTPETGPMQTPELLIDPLARQATAALTHHLAIALSNAELEAAQRAFSAAGNAPPKPGYEVVDALAFRALGPRFSTVAQRGLSRLAAGETFALPTAAESSSKDDCVLIVAVSPPESRAALILATPHGSHADARRGSSATVEICGTDLSRGEAVPPLSLWSSADAPIRWGIYRAKASVPD